MRQNKIIDSDPEKQKLYDFIDEQKHKKSEMPKTESSFDDPIQSIKNELRIFKEELKNELKKELKKEGAFIFENNQYMNEFHKKVIKYLEEEIRVQIKNADYHQYVDELIKDYIKNNLKPIIDLIVEKLVKDINNKLKDEYAITKELTYSIDKHLPPLAFASSRISSIVNLFITFTPSQVGHQDPRLIL